MWYFIFLHVLSYFPAAAVAPNSGFSSQEDCMFWSRFHLLCAAQTRVPVKQKLYKQETHSFLLFPSKCCILSRFTYFWLLKCIRIVFYIAFQNLSLTVTHGRILIFGLSVLKGKNISWVYINSTNLNQNYRDFIYICIFYTKNLVLKDIKQMIEWVSQLFTTFCIS